MVLDSNDHKALADLRRKRGVVKGALTRVRTFVNKFDPTLQAVSLLVFRQEELPQINRFIFLYMLFLELLMLPNNIMLFLISYIICTFVFIIYLIRTVKLLYLKKKMTKLHLFQ